MSYFVVAITCSNQHLFHTKAKFVPTFWSLEGAVTLSTTVCDDLEVTQVTTHLLQTRMRIDTSWYVVAVDDVCWFEMICMGVAGTRKLLPTGQEFKSVTHNWQAYICQLKIKLKHKVWRWYGEKRRALFGATRPVPSAELKSGETRFTDHFFVISLLLHTHFAGVKKNICFYFSLLLSPLPTDDVRAFLFCCVLKRHTQVFVQSKYKGLLHNTQGSALRLFFRSCTSRIIGMVFLSMDVD